MILSNVGTEFHCVLLLLAISTNQTDRLARVERFLDATII